MLIFFYYYNKAINMKIRDLNSKVAAIKREQQYQRVSYSKNKVFFFFFFFPFFSIKFIFKLMYFCIVTHFVFLLKYYYIFIFI